MAGRPILALATADSDAAWFLRQSNCARIVGHESPDRVAEILVELWNSWKAGTLGADVILRGSRNFTVGKALDD